MSCIQKAEPSKRRSIHKVVLPCYGVFNIKGHDELCMPFCRSLLFVTMSCIQKGEPSKRRGIYKAEPLIVWCF